MIQPDDLSSILFLDIECVSGKSSYKELDETFQDLWQHKAERLFRNEDVPEPEVSYAEKAGIYAEFGKIVCISVGIISSKDGEMSLRIKSFFDDDEAQLLRDFSQLLTQNRRLNKLCGHNIKEFDIPYICRRMVVNALPLPHLLNIAGKKPWELSYLLDTMTMWKFGDFKNYTSLKLLVALFGIPSPKDDIDGSEVGRVYWEEKDLKRIAVYCQKDVVATAQLMLRFIRLPLIEEGNIDFVT